MDSLVFLYISFSSLVRLTSIETISGFANLPSSTASLIRYFFTGGIISIISLYFGSNSLMVAVRPRIFLFGSAVIILNSFLKEKAVLLNK